MKNIDRQNTLFLLGGHDLEMCTIKDILKRDNYIYVDKGLKWDNALLSNYQDDIRLFLEEHPAGNIYGVELTNDIVPDIAQYKSIDHHNERHEEPCALEQIVSLFGLQMTRHYRLVAANDKLYIPGMQNIGATNEEINDIRKKDRRAQGVSDMDEYLAEKSISENMEKINDLIAIHSYTSAFSPICDRLYPYGSLLIYTSSEFTYYGAKSQKARRILADEYDKGHIYYGGGENGYIGSIKEIYTDTEIKNIIKLLKNELS